MNKKESISHKILSPISLLLLFFLLIKLFIYSNYYFHWNSVYFLSDDAIYAALAKRFFQGKFFEAVHPIWNPGFPLATIPFFLLVKSWEKAQFLVSILSSLALPLVAYFFIKKYSQTLAIIIVFVFTFSLPIHELVVVRGITEPLYILSLWSGIFTSYKGVETKKNIYYLVSGFLFGLTYLIRTDVMGILIWVVIILTFVSLLSTKKIAFIIPLVYFGIAFLIVNLPYFVIMSREFGRPTISGKYAFIGAPPPFALNQQKNTTFMQDVDSIDMPNYHSVYFNNELVLDAFYKNFLSKSGSGRWFTKRYFLQILSQYTTRNSDDFFLGNWLLLALVGLVGGLFIPTYRKLTLYLLPIWFVGTLWTAAFMAVMFRYLSFTLPFFLYLEALSIYLISRFLSLPFKKYSRLIQFTIISILLSYYFVANNMPKLLLNREPLKGRFTYNKIVGDWIKNNNIKLIGARQEAFAFYGDAKTIYIPAVESEKIVKYMKDWKAEYIIMRPDDAGYDFMRPITKPDYKHPDLILSHAFEDGTLAWKIKY